MNKLNYFKLIISTSPKKIKNIFMKNLKVV